MEENQKSGSLEELDVIEVFKYCLKANGIDEADSDMLLEAYKEISGALEQEAEL